MFFKINSAIVISQRRDLGNLKKKEINNFFLRALSRSTYVLAYLISTTKICLAFYVNIHVSSPFHRA